MFLKRSRFVTRRAYPGGSLSTEAGWRFHHAFTGPITGVDGQISAYHVDFKNRLLSISPTPVILSLVAGAAVLANVGDVKTDGRSRLR